MGAALCQELGAVDSGENEISQRDPGKDAGDIPCPGQIVGENKQREQYRFSLVHLVLLLCLPDISPDFCRHCRLLF